MIMIVGDTRDKRYIKILQRLGWGRMVIDTRIKPYPGEPWGFDNGAFRDWKNGKPFDEDAFLRRLDMAYGIGCPYLAVVPDIVAGGERSLEFSLRWLDKLPPDWPWYLAVQDGMKLDQVEQVIQHFAGIFLGGSNRFKATAWYWKQLAHKHGKKFHYARAGTPRKLEIVKEIKPDSLDSAFLLWISYRLEQFTREFQRRPHPTIWGPETWAIHPDFFGEE